MMAGFLDYIPGTSFLHRLNPLTKLLFSLILCVSCFVTDLHLFILGLILLNLALGFYSGIARRSLRILSALIKFSIVLFIVQVLVIHDGTALFYLTKSMPITDLGVSFSLLFVMRLIAATMPLTLMLSVTQMSDLSNVLVEKLGIPFRYTFALTTAIRFIPVFAAEMGGIVEAQTARGVAFDTKNIFKKLTLLLPLCVPLLISSVKRIESGAISAELRGFNLRKRGSGYKQYGIQGIDILALAVVVVIFVLGILF